MMETFVAGILFMWGMVLAAQSCEAQGPQIQITPETNDLTLFQGKEFRRLCEVDGVSGDVNVRFVWERDGSTIDSVEGTDQLQLYISEVEQVHAGTYTCRVVLTPQTSGAITNLGPVSAGTLTVLGRDLIDAPYYQVITKGASGSLNCSYPGGHVTWERQGNTVSTTFTSATFADEGLYMCDIYVPLVGASDKVPVMLYVVVPIQILETSRPVHQNLTRNQPVTFAVDFKGRKSHDLMITWYHSGLALSDDSRIYNTFDTDLGTGRSEFRLPLARRTDAGLYRVLISSVVGGDQEPPTFSSQGEATFQVDIAVRPIVPVGLHVDQVSSRTAQVTWTLNNETPDQSADELILRVTFANRSLADLLTLPGDLTTMTLENLIPAHGYSVVLTAVNSDGEVTTNPIPFSTLEGSPAIASLDVQRVNQTHFTVAVQLAYTGGGTITVVDVWYRVGSTGGMTSLMSVEPEVAQLSVMASVVLTDDSQQQAVEHEAGMQLEFTVVVYNQFNFPSDPKSDEVAAYFPPTTVSTSTGTGTTAIQMETPLLPLWLIAVIASVVTVLIMLILVAWVVAVCIHCRKASNKKFSPAAEVQPESGQNAAAENGRLSQTQSSDSLPTHIEQFRARSESSSQPSEGYTPSLEEYKKHKRELSECSSIGMTKAMITPSTTASNSPANFSKSQFINSQDKSLDCINELELASRGSDDSGTESERDRIRRMQQQKAMMSASPCSHNNMINYQYVQGHDPEYLRGHADGSLCGSSHHSLASSGHACMHSYPQLNLPEPRHFSRRRVGTEYMYSDCESVASTDVSCSNASLSSSWQQQKHHRAGLYRSPTPYNHEYTVTEESVV